MNHARVFRLPRKPLEMVVCLLVILVTLALMVPGMFGLVRTLTKLGKALVSAYGSL